MDFGYTTMHAAFPNAVEDPHEPGVLWDVGNGLEPDEFWRWKRQGGWERVALADLPKATPERVAIWVALRLLGVAC